jgi:mRNA interferase MazF
MGFRGLMARLVNRGEVWTYRFKEPDKRRPVVVLSRNEAIEVLATVLVAPVTSTIRDIPSQVVIGSNEGLDRESAVSLDHVQCVDRAKLIRRLGRLPPERMRDLCAALAVATGCE